MQDVLRDTTLTTTNMDILSHLFAVAILMIIAYSIRKFKPKSAENKSRMAPESKGSLPLIGHLHLLRGPVPIARILGSMADKYGPIFSLRLGSQPAVIVSSWEMVKDCFTTNDRIFVSRPRMATSKYLGYNYASFFISPYGNYWRDVRKMVTVEFLAPAPLERLRYVRASEIESCVKDLFSQCKKNGNDPSTKVTLNEWFEHLTFNISIRMLVGKRFPACANGEGDGEGWHFKEIAKKALFLSGLFVLSDAIPALEWMDIGGYISAMKQTAKDIDKVLGKWLEEHIERRKKGEEVRGEPDFMDVMLSRFPEDTIISGYMREVIIKATTLVLILTGSESTSETLTWASSLLLNNPHTLKTAQDELDANVGRDRWVEESDIINLHYLQAIVKETLRLYPPGPISGPREASEDCYVGGYHVPKGTRLVVNLWKLHRDPRVWSDPEEFQPERWLQEKHSNVNVRGLSFAYIPFSSGRRMCPGMTYGLQVVQLMLARLLQAFHLSAPKREAVDMSEGLGISLPKVKPLEVLLTPRLPLELYQNF